MRLVPSKKNSTAGVTDDPSKKSSLTRKRGRDLLSIKTTASRAHDKIQSPEKEPLLKKTSKNPNALKNPVVSSSENLPAKKLKHYETTNLHLVIF